MARVELSTLVKPQAPAGPGVGDSRRDHYEKRFESAKAVRAPYEPDWQEIERLCLPSRSNYLNSGTLKRRANTSKQDTAGRIAGRRATNGMASGFSNSALPWFEIGFRDPELNVWQPVKEWRHIVQQRIYALFASTNYYDAAKISYSQILHMGFSATLALEHDEYEAVWHPFEAGEVWIAQDDGLRVTTLFHRSDMTVANMVRKFPWNRLSKQVQNLYTRNSLQTLVPCMYVCEKNGERDESKFDSLNKAYRSAWWEIGNSDKTLLMEGGFDSKPFTAPRWETTGSQVYSDAAPAFDALPDLRELEFAARRRGRLLDGLARPAAFIPAGLQQTPISLDPGSINFINEMQGKVDFNRLDPNAYNAAVSDIERLTKRVDTLFYADLWMSISEMDGIQPRNEQELLYRNEEKLTQLGPVVDRINIEKLEVDIDRAYTILDNTGQLPPPPKEIEGKALQINFVSILAQAQRAAANNSIERAARFVGFITGMVPDAAIKFDAEQAIDEFANNTGTSPKIIRSDEIVAQMKEEMQAQAQAEQMREMAPAIRDAAQGAELLSRTRVGPAGEDISLLNQLMGQ